MKLEHLVEADTELRQCFQLLLNIQAIIEGLLQRINEADKRINWAFGEYKKEHEHEGERKPK